MTIEPQDAYTVLRRPLLPPKPERILPQPKLSMEDDAKLIRARFRRTWGPVGYEGTAEESNAQRSAEAKAKREAFAADIIADLAKQPRTTLEIVSLFNASKNAVRDALGLLRDRNLIICKRHGMGRIWTKIRERE